MEDNFMSKKRMNSPQFAQPLDSLSDKNRKNIYIPNKEPSELKGVYAPFICKKLPQSCTQCNPAWRENCFANPNGYQLWWENKSTEHGRCENCPLIAPTMWFEDEILHVKYPVFKKTHLMGVDPVFVAGAVIICSYDGTLNSKYEVYIGDNVCHFNVLKPVETVTVKNTCEESILGIQVNKNDGMNADNRPLLFTNEELVLLVSICNSAIARQANLLSQIDLDNNEESAKKFQNNIKDIFDIREKILNFISDKKG